MTNRAQLLINGDTILPSLLADLRAARRTIHVSMFLWFNDPIGLEIADVLVERAHAGVKVRVLLNVEKTAMGDPFSTGEAKMMRHDPSVRHDPTNAKPLCQKMRDAGIEVRDTNIDYDAVVPGLDARLRSIGGQIADTIDLSDLHIDHRKIVVVDGRIGYCGGANIGAQYMYHLPFDPTKNAYDEGTERKERGEPEPWWKWHDSLTRFEGPIAADLDEHFRERFVLDGGNDFALEVTPGTAEPRGMPIRDARVVFNAPNDQPNEVLELYVRLIGEAQRSIFIENPYFYHPALVEALCEAKTKRPDLDVTMVLPALAWNDNEFSQDAQQHEYTRYLACGIAVYEYQRHFNHFKMAVFDERWSIHGSTNGNFRSLERDTDFELVVLVDDEALARDVLTRVRDVDVTHAKRIGHDDVEGSFAAFRVRHRDPRTMLLYSRKVL
jgi:cardiolipin synthase